MEQDGIAQKVKKLRQKDGLSQKALARKAGVASSTIINLERGKKISVNTLRLVAKALDMPSSYFLAD